MARENIPVGLFYASYPSDCTYELNSSLKLLREMLVEGLIGEPLDQMATKNRGQALERLVACLLGYKISDAELLYRFANRMS